MRYRRQGEPATVEWSARSPLKTESRTALTGGVADPLLLTRNERAQSERCRHEQHSAESERERDRPEAAQRYLDVLDVMGVRGLCLVEMRKPQIDARVCHREGVWRCVVQGRHAQQPVLAAWIAFVGTALNRAVPSPSRCPTEMIFRRQRTSAEVSRPTAGRKRPTRAA